MPTPAEIASQMDPDPVEIIEYIGEIHDVTLADLYATIVSVAEHRDFNVTWVNNKECSELLRSMVSPSNSPDPLDDLEDKADPNFGDYIVIFRAKGAWTKEQVVRALLVDMGEI